MSMDIVFEKHSIQGAPDFEVQVPRDAPLEFELAYIPGRNHPGLVFYIAGFNDPEGYSEGLLRSIVRDYGYAAVAVKYHCFKSRLQQGAQLALTTRSERLMRLVADQWGMSSFLEPPLSSRKLNDFFLALKENTTSDVDFHGILQPPNGEYQNFGVMQALDHLYVSEHLQRQGLPANFGNIMLLGSSHGGYIALLINKLAPGFASMVIDNSSYVRAPLNYIWDPEVESDSLPVGETYDDYEKFKFNMHCATLWRHGVESGDPCHYGPAQDAIRNMALKDHFDLAKSFMDQALHVYSWNASEGDLISPVHEKQVQQGVIHGGPMIMDLEFVRPDQVDGVTFKTMSHGMGASLKGLFALAHERLPSIPERTIYPKINRIAYDCGPSSYVIERTGNHDYPLMLSVKPS